MPPSTTPLSPSHRNDGAVVIGGGPAGLMAAEVLAARGVPVDVYDAMPSVGRKFLMAGKGGMNITHAEPADAFLARYGARADRIAPMLAGFGPQALRDWVHALGIDTFVGSSGRVFPTDMKAAPLLRAWLHRLRTSGVRLHMRHRWIGLDDDGAGGYVLRFATPSASDAPDASDASDAPHAPSAPSASDASHSPHAPSAPSASDAPHSPHAPSASDTPHAPHAPHAPSASDTPPGEVRVGARAVVLALGGGSWARLGSDGAWAPLLAARGVTVAPLKPANCGFDVDWSEVFRARYAGEPVKSAAIGLTAPDGTALYRQGEFVISATGIEGSLVYALSAPIRDLLDARGEATIHLDLAPGLSAARVAEETGRPRGARSVSSHLQSRLGITGVKAGLLREVLSKDAMHDPVALAAGIKALPLTPRRARPVDEVISTAGGVAFEAMDAQLMLASLPGVFCAGEMLDWEAPTGGYLLTACLASGRVAGDGAASYLHHASA